MNAMSSFGIVSGLSGVIAQCRNLVRGRLGDRAFSSLRSHTHGKGDRLKACLAEDSLQALFDTFDAKFSRQVSSIKPVAVLSKYNDTSRKICRWVEGLGTIGFVVSDEENFSDWIASQGNELSCVIIDENFIDREKAYRFVADLRMSQPRVAVMVLSSGEEKTRLEGLDAWPADAVLSAPITPTGLKIGILAAIENNEVPLPAGSMPGGRSKADKRARSTAPFWGLKAFSTH